MTSFIIFATFVIISASIASIAVFLCRQKYVRTYSKRYQRFLEINRSYQAYAEPIPGNERHIPHAAKTLAKLNNLQMYSLLMDTVKKNREHWEGLIIAYEEKNMAAEHYKKLWNGIVQLEEPIYYMRWYIRQKGFDKIACRLMTDEKLQISTKYCIHWDASYTSPARRNHYAKRLTADINDIKKAVDDCYKKQGGRAPIKPSLRFKIFKRDGYRCQLCGAAQVDGVKLEVDHKVPVAKGGTNAKSNLWVLCFHCNRGKGVQIL